MTGETRLLGRFLAGKTLEDLPTELVHEAKRMILDTVGVSLAAVEDPAVRIAKDSVSGGASAQSRCHVLGDDRVVPATDAAFVNGIMAHVLDLDDTHARIGGHPSVPVLPAVLAVAEETGASGSDLLTAFALGVEAETVLGDVMNPGHYSHGWHPTAILGRLGAAVGAGVLLDFDEGQFARAIGLAASGASGIKGNFGTMTKSFHVGNAARGGVEAARLVDGGFTASESILEGEVGGFCRLFQGDPPYEFGERFGHLGDPWGSINPPPGFKPYPCCGSVHAPIDAALAIRERHGVEFDAIDRVLVVEHPRRLPHTDRPTPTTALEGKFSVQYVVGRALLDGDVWLDDFTEEAVNDPTVQRFLDRVDVRGDPDVRRYLDDVPGASRANWETWDTRFTDQVPRRKHAYLQVRLDSGETYDAYVDAPSGTPPNAMSNDELRDKFRRCTADCLPKERIEEALDLLGDLENVEDVFTALRPLV